MWTRQEVKAQGKTAFRAQYWRTVLVALLLTILTTAMSFSTSQSSGDNAQSAQDLENAFNGLSTEQQAAVVGVLSGAAIVIMIVSLLLRIFVFNPLEVGCYGFLKENVKRGDADLGVLKTGFQAYGHTFVTLLLRDIFLILWTILFIIPGIIKAYSYRMVPFILRDHPELSATEVIKASQEMMKGQKWNTFVLDLSFIGWLLLSAVTIGIVGVFWTNPYMQSTNAALYLKLNGEESEIADAEVVEEPEAITEPESEPEVTIPEAEEE